MIYILTYDIPHRKTQDTLNLLLHNYTTKEICVIAKPMARIHIFKPLLQHRPYPFNVNTKNLCQNLGIEYVTINEYTDFNESGKILLCGAGILPGRFIKAKKIINSHPGYLPLVRGLDAYKWALYYDKPIGVTTHYIGEEPDTGVLISRQIIKIQHTDTFYSVAMRIYELEIQMLVNALEMEPTIEILEPEGESSRRMPHEKEMVLLQKFEKWRVY